ncbi:uncharacterized protein [Rutidosis leptorrhynchoides]|uniref:uncharacterized protein n=1 Tax=Rutidosis leptorrhynchoides TaxID=125765 RepID=UPI003A9A15BB
MDEQRHDLSSVIPWVWVSEALANLKEVDVTTLINVFIRSPKITNGVGSNAREIVSFRILERLFESDTRPLKPVQRAQSSGASFDFSKSCEDVLHHILAEMNEPNIWDESEKSKWHAKPFIAYKRSCFSNSDLRRIKDTLVGGKPSYLTSLKQMVTSLHLNIDGTKVHDVNGATSSNNQDKISCTDDTSIEENSNGEEEFVEPISEYRPRNDEEWYHVELNDISTKKHMFFSSICKNNEGFSHWKETNICMKCNKGGTLLVCSSNACSFVIHASCLVSISALANESTAKFYCPFCRHSQAIASYWRAKRNASLARNDIAFFNCSSLKNIPERSHKSTDGRVDFRIINGVLNPDLGNRYYESSGSEGCSEEGQEQTDHTDYSIRPRMQIINPCTNLYVPQRRRVPVPWTQSEEETLKKWVDKFTGDGFIPWRKILDLGSSKFQRGRTPGDLKDKWRNMSRSSN